jgi:hypothetical protein
MIVHAFMIDDFFPQDLFLMLRELAIAREFGDVLAPDGIVYPGVSVGIPGPILQHVDVGLTWWLGRKIVSKSMFLRLRLEGQPSPHWVHTDTIFSQYAFFLHINPDAGSTVLVHHVETGMAYHPTTEEEVALWEKDKNNYHAWEIDSKLEGAPNRAVVIRSDRLHAALPLGGYGDSPANGRLVLTSFFDV